MDLLADMLAAAQAAYPREACGLVVSAGKRPRLLVCENSHPDPTRQFRIADTEWLRCEAEGEILAVFHSHPNGTAQPSEADKSVAEALGLPWHIVSWPQGDHQVYVPCGYEVPYLGRVYVYGIHDCYTLCQDWYRREWGLKLKHYETEEGWWARGENWYMEHYAENGFVKLPPSAPPQAGDMLLMQVGSDVASHSAIYLGDGIILHHLRNRLSRRDVYGGYWAKNTLAHLRHCSKM